MYKDKKTIAIIPARGGSKGLPKKNIKLMCGKPLIVWSIASVLSSKLLDKVFVSTDCPEIASIAESFGVEVPFLRPAELAQDTSPSCDAIIHVLDELAKKGEKYDYVALIEPTSPLRKEDDIDNALKSLIDSETSSLVSVGEVHMEHPMIVKKIIDNKLVSYVENIKKIHQRQQADKAYFPYGVAYICKTDIYKQEKTFYLEDTLPYFIERWQNYEVDDEWDFLVIENILKRIKGK